MYRTGERTESQAGQWQSIVMSFTLEFMVGYYLSHNNQLTADTSMSMENELLNKAEFLAQLTTGQAGFDLITSSVQCSHRFPLTIYTQIENLAQLGNVSISVIIN